jgi:hypothetical protein
MSHFLTHRRLVLQGALVVSMVAFQATGCGEIRYRDAIVAGPEVRRIIVRGDVGVIEIVPGTQARVDLAVRAPEGAALIQHHEVDRVLEVRSSCRTPILCAVDAEVHVPEGVPVQVEIDRGEIWATGVNGLDLSVGDGEVDVDTLGPATIQIGHGAARVFSRGTGTIRVAVGSGDIDVHVRPGDWNVDVTAANQSVSGVTVNPAARGSLELVAPAGTVRVVGKGFSTDDSGTP